MISATMIADSVAPNGVRLSTMCVRYPRFIHGEVMTHRVFARNAASSRAIPWKKSVTTTLGQAADTMIVVESNQRVGDIRKNHSPDTELNVYVPNCMYAMIKSDPVVPLHWGKEQSGMQVAVEKLDAAVIEKAEWLWRQACDSALAFADRIAKLGVHKSIVSRITEPFMWMTTLISSTEWSNFYGLRIHEAAEPHMRQLAVAMHECQEASIPVRKGSWEWHLPYVESQDILDSLFGAVSTLGVQYTWQDMSAARCARLSYMTHDGERDAKKDMKLAEKLRTSRPIHASPFEHVATPLARAEDKSGCFYGWKQYRQVIEESLSVK